MHQTVPTPPKYTPLIRGARTEPPGYVAKLASNPAPNKDLTHNAIDHIIKDELKGHTLMDVPGLIEHVFPDSALPNGTIPQKIFSYIQNPPLANSPPLYKAGQWSLAPFSPDRFSKKGQELGAARFFNAICAMSALAAGSAMERAWTAEYATRGLSGISVTRQPDVILFDNELLGTRRPPQAILDAAFKQPIALTRKNLRRQRRGVESFQNL